MLEFVQWNDAPGCQCWSPQVQRSKARKQGSDWLRGGVIDQPLSVLKGNGDGVDWHALVLHRLPPSFHQAVHQDSHHGKDGQAQEGGDRYNNCEGDQNVKCYAETRWLSNQISLQ